jgi:hypothetical protein
MEGLPVSTSTMLMQPGTGQTCWRRLQPTHSASITSERRAVDRAAGDLRHHVQRDRLHRRAAGQRHQDDPMLRLQPKRLAMRSR